MERLLFSRLALEAAESPAARMDRDLMAAGEVELWHLFGQEPEREEEPGEPGGLAELELLGADLF